MSDNSNGSTERVSELTAQERAFDIGFRLAEGEELTTRQVAEMTGLSMTGAWYLMQRGARVRPITQDGRGRWKRIR
jgi:hypothetical protein